MTNAAAATRKFEGRIWEKVEHWHFYATVEAKDEIEARKLFVKDYPRRDYSVSEIR